MRCHYGYLVLAFLGILTVVRSGTVPAEVRVRQKPSTRGSKERFVHKRDHTRGGSIVEESAPPTIIAQAELQSAVQSKPTMMLPVTTAELPKFLSLSAMMFLIVYIFTISRDTKDALIVTNCGAEAIAFLKVYGVIPAASAFLLLYSYLANKFPPQTLFYITVAPFIAFYFAFAFFLYPLRNALHPMSIPLPQGGMSYAVNLLRHWTFSLYYIMSELWGSAGIPLLFWSCANDVIRIDQAKRLYPLISLVGNLGPIFSGLTMSHVSRVVAQRVASDDLAFEVSLQVLAVCTTAAGALICALYGLTQRLHQQDMAGVITATERAANITTASATSNVGSLSAVAQQGNVRRNITTMIATSISPSPPVVRVKKPKLSFAESTRLLLSDPYLRNIATMVLSYGLTMEFTEIIWKSTVKKAFPVKTEYLIFMGRYSTYVGAAAFGMMFVGTSIVQALGWRAGALVTPVTMGLAALPFFASIMRQGEATPLALRQVVYIGLLQNVLSKASKYAVFDPTKEMAYIPLDADSKTKGKAAIDVLGARLGKSGGALVQQGLVLLFGSILRGAPVIAVLFYASIFAWIGAVNSLSPMFARRSADSEEQRRTQKLL